MQQGFKKYIEPNETSVRIAKYIHKELLSYLENSDRKIGKFVGIAILEEIAAEKSRNK